MRGVFAILFLLCFGILSFGAELPASSLVPGKNSLKKVSLTCGNMPTEGWAFLKEKSKQRLNGTLSRLPAECGGVRIAISLALPEGTVAPEKAESVWMVQMTQDKKSDFAGRPVNGVPVRTAMPLPGGTAKTLVLESYYPVDPVLPLKFQVERLTSDPADTFPGAVILTGVTVTPLAAPAAPVVVESASGYNSWPFIALLRSRLVCAYSRGQEHSIDEPERGAYYRVSDDGGLTWSAERLLVNTAEECEVVSSKGFDENYDLLLWVRCRNSKTKTVRFELYRSADGEYFEKIAMPKFSPMPMQIMDVLRIPGKGLMCLWFAGNYKQEDGSQCWGTLFSNNNGLTWEQKTVESRLRQADWPTEPSAVWLGNGRILAIGRKEGKGSTTEQAQFQLQSSDSGATWTKMRTNITDVRISTPSLIFDMGSSLLTCYHFFRGRGILNRRVVKPEAVWDRPLNWPAPETVALGKPRMSDSGNVNATALFERHLLAYYMGDRPNTSVVVAPLPAPGRERQLTLFGTALSSMGGGIRSAHSAERLTFPIWLFLKEGKKQRIGTVVKELPADCKAVRVEAELIIPSGLNVQKDMGSVWALQLSQKNPNGEKDTRIVESAPVRAEFQQGERYRRIVLESYCPIDPSRPLQLRLERLTADPFDTFLGAVGMSRFLITPLAAPPLPGIVENSPGYNGWPLFQQMGDKLVCAYSRGKGHFVTDPDGNSYSRISEDGGFTWGPENPTFDYEKENVGVTGIGLDEKGALLCWTRAWGTKRTKRFEVHRSTDGKKFVRVAEPKLDPLPMQIMEPVRIPGKGLLCLWFAGNYKADDGSQCWGTLRSLDNGLTWKQKTVESGLKRADWPTEPAMVYLGDGRILGLARIEGRGFTAEHALFQLQSSDGGETWTKTRTNITDVRSSTPSLIFDPVNRYVTCYYFYRGRGLLNRRSAQVDTIWDNPTRWLPPETVALGKTRVSDSGNVYAVLMNGNHVITYYMGDRSQTSVVSVVLPAAGLPYSVPEQK